MSFPSYLRSRLARRNADAAHSSGLAVFGLTVAAGVHWALSTLFPDHESLVSRCILAQDVWDGKFDESDDSAADHRGIVDYSEREKEDGERGDLAPSLEKEKDKAGSDSGVLV